MNVSSKFYPGDLVECYGKGSGFRGKVLDTNDTDQTVYVHFTEGPYTGKKSSVPGKAARVLPPHEISVK